MPNRITAYVSVTDQNGYAVDGLLANDFTVTETAGATTDQPVIAGAGLISFGVAQDMNPRPALATVILMDYSGSSSRLANGNESAMENAVISFVEQMGPDDQAMIVKFAEYASKNVHYDKR